MKVEAGNDQGHNLAQPELVEGHTLPSRMAFDKLRLSGDWR
jgi:hypothetical protein